MSECVSECVWRGGGRVCVLQSGTTIMDICGPNVCNHSLVIEVCVCGVSVCECVCVSMCV